MRGPLGFLSAFRGGNVDDRQRPDANVGAAFVVAALIVALLGLKWMGSGGAEGASGENDGWALGGAPSLDESAPTTIPASPAAVAVRVGATRPGSSESGETTRTTSGFPGFPGFPDDVPPPGDPTSPSSETTGTSGPGGTAPATTRTSTSVLITTSTTTTEPEPTTTTTEEPTTTTTEEPTTTSTSEVPPAPGAGESAASSGTFDGLDSLLDTLFG